ncbi:MAG: hypothetical protein UZ06_CHB003001770 [Chlorobi bacterium OLB6]|nr:MAG: hypothetical protein UZ06_CHB003001770 [Chlorobi bacterium OLB6]
MAKKGARVIITLECTEAKKKVSRLPGTQQPRTVKTLLNAWK